MIGLCNELLYGNIFMSKWLLRLIISWAWSFAVDLRFKACVCKSFLHPASVFARTRQKTEQRAFVFCRGGHCLLRSSSLFVVWTNKQASWLSCVVLYDHRIHRPSPIIIVSSVAQYEEEPSPCHPSLFRWPSPSSCPTAALRGLSDNERNDRALDTLAQRMCSWLHKTKIFQQFHFLCGAKGRVCVLCALLVILASWPSWIILWVNQNVNTWNKIESNTLFVFTECFRKFFVF